MDQNNNSHTNDNLAAGVTDAVETPSGGAWPRSVLVIGCGLLGMSLALAIKSLDASRTLVGVEPNRMHRSIAAARGGFDDVLASMHDAAQGSVPR
jgi:threonine dehydrogenase-like Zn-dependent dehydrogenase